MVATLPSVLPCNRMRGRNKIADYVSRFCEILTKDGALRSCKMVTVCNNGRNAPMAHVRCPQPRSIALSDGICENRNFPQFSHYRNGRGVLTTPRRSQGDHHG